METYLGYKLVGEGLKTSLSALGLPDSETRCVWLFFVEICYQQNLCSATSNIDDTKDRVTAVIKTVRRNILRRA